MRKKGGNEESVRNRALDFNIYRIEIAKLARVSGSEGLTPPPGTVLCQRLGWRNRSETRKKGNFPGSGPGNEKPSFLGEKRAGDGPTDKDDRL